MLYDTIKPGDFALYTNETPGPVGAAVRLCIHNERIIDEAGFANRITWFDSYFSQTYVNIYPARWHFSDDKMVIIRYFAETTERHEITNV